MADATGQVVQDTMEGAVTGAPGGPWGALIGGVVGLLGGVIGVRATKRAEDERDDLEREIRRQLGIKLLRKRTAKLLPLERGSAIAELKGRVETATAQSLASKGLTGTGAGESIRGISTAVTDIDANRRAVAGAKALGIDKARALGAEIERIRPTPSAAEAMLTGFVRGALMASRLGTRPTGPVTTPRQITEAIPDMSAARSRLLLGSRPDDFEAVDPSVTLPGLISR